MKASEEHKRYLKKPYHIQCHTEVFTPEEVEILQQYGAWFEALMLGKIKPETSGQEHFLQMCRGETGPINDYERVWRKYLDRRAWESLHRSHRHYESRYENSYEIPLMCPMCGAPNAYLTSNGVYCSSCREVMDSEELEEFELIFDEVDECAEDLARSEDGGWFYEDW